MGLFSVGAKGVKAGSKVSEGLLDKLFAHHNLSQDALDIAKGAGGIPMPSVAVSKAEHPLENFGDITLMLDPSAIKPSKKTKVFPTDAYTGRQPRADVYIKSPQTLLDNLKDNPDFGHLKGLSDLVDTSQYDFDSGDYLVRSLYSGVAEGYNPKKYKTVDSYLKSLGPMYMPLDDAKGIRELAGLKYETFLGDDYDAEDLIKSMRKKGAFEAGAEGFGSSGRMRGLLSDEFESFEDIKSARDLIVPESDMSLHMNEFDDNYIKLMSNMSEDKYFNLLNREEQQDIIAGVAASKMPKWANNIPKQTVDNLKSEVGKLKGSVKDMPTAYFEAKLNKVLGLTDPSIKGAIIPSGATKAEDTLRKAGVKNIKKYTSESERSQLVKQFPELFFAHPMTGAATGLLGLNEFNRTENMGEFDNRFRLPKGQQRGSILPVITNDQGFVELGLPQFVVDTARGLFDVGQSRKTGVINPASLLEIL